MNPPIRVLLADDHPLVRAGVSAALAIEEDMQFVGEAANGEQAQRLCRSLQPDVLLLDLDMPGPPITDVVRTIQKQTPLVKILVLTAYRDDGYIRRLLALGVAGYALKDESPQAVIQAIRTVHKGASWFSGAVMQRFVQGQLSHPSEDSLSALTERERQLLERIALGWDNTRIAAELHLAEQTVRNYVSRLYDKIGVTTRAQAIVWAQERGVMWNSNPALQTDQHPLI